MKKIILILFLSTVLSGCGPRADISPKKMTDILTEVYLADQYVELDDNMAAMADTSFVYDALFEQYGYTREDFMNSLEYYRRNPEQFVKILTDVRKSLADFLVANTTRDNEESVENVDSVDNEDNEADSVVEDEIVEKNDFVVAKDKDVVQKATKKEVTEKKLTKKEIKNLENKWK